VGLLSSFGKSYSQNAKLSLELKNSSVESVLNYIESHTEYSFMYDNQKIDINREVNITVKNQTVESILNQLFENGVSYKMIGKHIIITPKENELSYISEQAKSITGKVTDSSGAPLPGVTVAIKGANTGTITDANGKFNFANVSGDATLVISFVGMKTQEVKLAGKSSINVTMQEEAIGIAEVVAVGYISQKKELLTGAVEYMKVSDEMKTLPSTSAANALAGEIAGVNVSTPDGVPGSNATLSIRTNLTFKDASSFKEAPVVFVIDGVVRDGDQGIKDFNNLSQNEIESYTVLKDAASAAIYGSRSAGGVILVTTKRGKTGKPVLNYSFSQNFETRTKPVSLTNAVQTGEIYNRVQTGGDWSWTQEELDYIKTVNNGWGYDQLSTVWQNPNTQTHNLSLTGGSDKIKYFAGASYVKQNGFLAPMTYNKYNFRVNVTADITKDLQLFAGMSLNNNYQTTHIWNDDYSYYTKLLIWQPDQPVFTESGKAIDYGWAANVGSTVRGDGGYRKISFLSPHTVFNLTYKLPFVKGLSAKAAFAQNWNYQQYSGFFKAYPMAVMKRDGGPGKHIYHTDDASILSYKNSTWYSNDYLEKEVTWSRDYQLNLQLSFDRTFSDKHNVQGTLVYEKSQRNNAGLKAGIEKFPVYTTDQLWAASGARADSWVDRKQDYADQTNGRVSYIGQFGYSYDDKYMFNFSFREDGSMNFAPDQRWGFFPAASAGWVISKESFFNRDAIDYLKIRASIGLTGNDAVGGWQWQQSYKQDNQAYFGTTPSMSPGLTYGSLVNPKLTWEKSLSYDFGADMNFLGHWDASLGYWYRKTYDILGPRQASVPTSFSLSMPDENYGEMHAQGFDLTLGYKNQTGAFEYHGNLTLSYGWNKVVTKDYAQNAKPIDIPVGRASNYIKGYLFDQIIRTQEQLDQFNAAHPGYKISGVSPALGMMVYKDLSGPGGKPDNIIDGWDNAVIKASNFPIVYGLKLGASWKGISVETMLNGRLKELKQFKDLSDGVEWNRMWTEWYDNSWTPDNPNAWLPQRIKTTKTYKQTTDFWYKDASFMRMKYLTVAYTLPKRLTANVLDKVKLYFTGTNLFVVSGFKYYDPEMGGGTAFPIMRTFNFGIDVTF